MSDTLPAVSVLVSSKDRHALLREAVASLRQLDYPRSQVEIVVVEETDEPDDPGADRYVTLPREGRGFAWSRNAALRAASHPLVAFTDDDCIVDPSWLRELIAPFEDPEVGAVAGGVLAQPSGLLGKTEIVLGFPGGGLRRICRAPGAGWASTRDVSTVNAAARRELVEALGGFCERTGIYGGEDSDLFSRLTERRRAVFNPRALVFHRARDSVSGIVRWFYRRGIAEVTLASLFSRSFRQRALHHARTSFLLRVTCLVAALVLLRMPIAASLLALGGLYYVLMLVRYRFAPRHMGWRAWLLTPVTKLLMDLAFDVGRLAGLMLPRRAGAAAPSSAGVRPFRLLLVENSGSVRGGGQVSFLGLMKGLDRSRFDLVVVCPDEGDFFDAVREMGIPAFVLPMPTLRRRGWLFLPLHLRSWCRFLRRREIELVHANGTRAMIYAGIAARLTGLPGLWHVRVLGRERALDWLLARLSTRVLVNSEAVARRFGVPKVETRGPSPDVVPNGVDVESFANALPDPTLAGDQRLSGRYVLVVLAQLVRWKRHDLALEMLAAMKEHGCEAALLIVGDELPASRGYRAYLVNCAAELGLSDRCVFAGFRDDVPAVLKLADVLIHTATPEPFGRALIEAMAAGIPVVAAAGGGVAEIIEQGVTGTIVTSDDPAHWAAIVQSLLADEPRRRRMGLAGRRRVQSHFTKELHARRVQQIYQEVLSSRR